MKLLKTDRLVPLVTITLTALCSYLLYADFTGTFTRTGSERIGTLTYQKRIAERRYAEEVIWEIIGQNATVYNCDYLRTMDGSAAIVRLNDGTDIEIDENTMVMICSSKQGVDVDLDRGSFVAKKKPDGRPMKVTTRFGGVAVRDGAMSLGVSKKGLSLHVTSGSAEVSAGGKKEKVDPGYSTAVGGGAIVKEKDFARQVSPDINRYFVITGKELRVNFAWETDRGRTVMLQVARDAAFTTMAAKEKEAGETRASLGLPAGAYYWRLADESGKTGPARAFTIISDRPAVPLTPSHGENISARGKSALVRFAWEPAAAASDYTIEIAGDAGFRKQALALKSETNSIATDRLAPGSYYWRIRNNYGFSADAVLYSEARRFGIVRAGEMVPPDPLVPDNGAAVPDVSIAAGSVLFNWNSDPGYSGYEFTIARDGAFRTIAYQERSPDNFHKPEAALAKGTYYWRVRGVTAAGAFSPPSGTFRFTVTGAVPPVLTAPGPDAVLFQDGSEKVDFRWNGPDGGQRYRFELSSDRDFRKLLRGDDVTGLSHAVPLPGTGTYYWRVTLAGTGGRTLVSDRRAFSVTKSLPTPGGASPSNNEAVEITSRSGMVFRWNPVAGATGYLVSVKRVVNGAEREVYSTRVETARYQFTRTELLDAGSFMWEVSAVRQKENEAEMRSKPGKNYFTIKPGKRLSAPELKSRVLYVK